MEGLQPAAAEGGEDESSVAECGCGEKVAVSGDAGDHEEVDGVDVQLGQNPQPAGDPVRGTISAVVERESRLHSVTAWYKGGVKLPLPQETE